MSRDWLGRRTREQKNAGQKNGGGIEQPHFSARHFSAFSNRSQDLIKLASRKVV
jgi:hypothetical protein